MTRQQKANKRHAVWQRRLRVARLAREQLALSLHPPRATHHPGDLDPQPGEHWEVTDQKLLGREEELPAT